jgi:N,N'-diacetyllegionaminate synthase
VEKHFTLSHDFSEFRDHRLSAEPTELAELVRRVEAVGAMVGKPEKTVQPAESEMVSAVRRSIVAAADLPAGHRLAPEDLTWLRPRDGLAPGEEEALLDRRLKRAVAFGETLRPSDAQ